MYPFAQQVTFLFTDDLAASAAFYEGVLELPLVLDQGVCHIYRVAANAFVGFCTRATALADDVHRAHSVILTLVTDNVDEWAQRLADAGVALEKPPQLNTNYNIYHCFVRDPNGYLIEIQRFLDPTWPQPQ
jgi:catechol 2,3-dioxygenase-like lactoylglutathione lyase family enzyme